MSVARPSPAVTLAVEALKRRGVTVSAVTAKDGTTVLLVGDVVEPERPDHLLDP
jgi:hypothetical protein